MKKETAFDWAVSFKLGIWRSRSRAAPAGGRLPPRGRWTGRSPGRMRGTQPSRRTGPDEWALPGRSLSQPTADSSLYAREPLYRPQSEIFIGARMFSVAGHPSSVRALPCHLPRRGRLPPGGGLGYRAFRDDERVFLPHPSGLTPCHLPRRGRLPPGGGEGFLPAGGFHYRSLP